MITRSKKSCIGQVTLGGDCPRIRDLPATYYGPVAETPALEDRLVEAATAALEVFSIHLGRRLGLYSCLVTPMTVEELAATAGIDLRYAREWLEQQASAGFVEVDDPEARWELRRFSLNPHQQEVLLVADHPSHVAPLTDMLAGIASVLPEVADAYRSGGGVPYSDYGGAFRSGQAGINRPAFTHQLVREWIPGTVPAIESRLREGGKIADLGCGAGWSTIALTRAYPRARVIGYDLDPSSIEDAAANARAEGVEVEFRVANASQVATDGPFDLVLVLEALHDMSNPVEVLSQIRATLASSGALLVADELVAPTFTAPGDLLDRMMYGWSVLACLPSSKAEDHSAALGTVLREPRIRELATEAGFSRVEVPEVDAGFFRLYLLS